MCLSRFLLIFFTSKKKMILVISLRRFDRKKDVVSLFPGLENPGSWQPCYDRLKVVTVGVAIRTEDPLVEAYLVRRIPLDVRPGEDVGFVNYPDAPIIAVRRGAQELERIEMHKSNFLVIDEERVPVGALRLRRVCHSVQS